MATILLFSTPIRNQKQAVALTGQNKTKCTIGVKGKVHTKIKNVLTPRVLKTFMNLFLLLNTKVNVKNDIFIFG